MFKAVTENKSVFVDYDPSSSKKAAIRRSEDILSSTIFCRLSYLSDAARWYVLSEALGEPFSNYRVSSLKSIEFWPSWELSGSAVEPDLFINLEAGDPPNRFNFIFEAKLNSSHTSEQLCKEWRAFFGSPDNSEMAEGATTYLCAIGGSITDEIISQSKVICGDSFVVAYASWSDISEACTQAQSKSFSKQDCCILTDMVDALAWFGFRSIRRFDSIGVPRELISSLDEWDQYAGEWLRNVR